MVLSAVPKPSNRCTMAKQQQQQRTPLKVNDNVVEVKSKVSTDLMTIHVSGNVRIQGLTVCRSTESIDITLCCHADRNAFRRSILQHTAPNSVLPLDK